MNIEPGPHPNLKEGNLLEVQGAAQWPGFAPEIGAASIRAVGRARRPFAPMLSFNKLTSIATHCRLVHAEGIVIDVTKQNEYRVPLAPVEETILAVVPGSVPYPPELSYPDPSHTTERAVVLRDTGRSHLIFSPGDVDPSSWHSGHIDLCRLLRISIRWVAGEERPVTIAGDGLIEAFARETHAGFAIHLLNCTNPAMHPGWIREFYPIGELRVRMRLPEGRKVSRVELLRSAADIPFRLADGAIAFTIPKFVDYEVAAMYSQREKGLSLYSTHGGIHRALWHPPRVTKGAKLKHSRE